MPQPVIQAQVGNLKLGVTEDQARAFAQKWDTGGIKMILDNTSISFANAWANIALKSALENPDVQMEIFKQVVIRLKAAKAVAPVAPQAEAVVAPAPETKSGIIITG